MTFDHSVLTHYSPIFDFTYTYTASGTPLAAVKSASITVISNKSSRLTLSSVFCIPKLIMQLLSVGKITDCNYNILFTSTSYIVQNHTGQKIGKHDIKSTACIS